VRGYLAYKKEILIFMMINKEKCTIVYKRVCKYLLQKKERGINFISPIELNILIKKAQKEVRRFLNSDERRYIIGYFKRSRILIPTGQGLNINLWNLRINDNKNNKK